MSPLARSLLALACTALLHAACAAAGPRSQYCNSVLIGHHKNHLSSRQHLTVNHIGESLVVVPDLVTKPGVRLVAQEVFACNWNGTGAPDVAAPPKGFSPIQVTFKGTLPKYGLGVYVEQYSEMIIPPH